MSQSFIEKPDNGPHSALAGLGVLSTERAPSDPADVLRRIVAWRDSVHAGRIVRGAVLEALIEEGRAALGAPACPPAQPELEASERVERLIDACEGELDGLAVDHATACRIMFYIDHGRAPENGEEQKL